jgi:hypothetical protein
MRLPLLRSRWRFDPSSSRCLHEIRIPHPSNASLKTNASIGPKSNEGITKLLSRQIELSYAIAASALFPPHRGILGTVQHLRQLFLDLEQPVGAHFHS